MAYLLTIPTQYYDMAFYQITTERQKDDIIKYKSEIFIINTKIYNIYNV